MSRKSLIDVLFQEIIDEIIDYLEDDKKSLISCTHTCRAFLPRAQTHIFRYVPIVTRKLDDWAGSILPTKRIETLSDIVKKHPILPRNIRILRLEISDDGAWLSQDVNFLFIMTLLDRSKELIPTISIMGENLDLPTIQFPTQPEFRPRLWKPLVAPFITKLILTNLEKVPIGIFLICPRLHFLRVAHISIDTKKTFGAQVGQPQLETFEFNNCSQAVDDIFGLVNSDGPHVNPGFLRSLDVSPQISCLPRLMAATASSLEKLVIDDIECHSKLSIFFNLSKLPALKTIHIDYAVLNGYRFHPFDGLSDLLSSSGQSTMIEKVEIAMSIYPSFQLGLDDRQWWEAKNPGWSQLDKALNHLTTLSGFRNLSVQIHFMKVGGTISSGGQQPMHWGDEWEAEVRTLDCDRFPLSFRNPGVAFVCSFEVLERDY